MNYHNVYQATDKTFLVLICTRAGRYTDKGYATLEEAAWQADRAKWVLNNHGLIGRLSAYNFPERLNAESESAWSVLPPPLVEFYCKHPTTDNPVTEDQAAQIEEAKILAASYAERLRLIDDETKKLNDEAVKGQKLHLDLLTKQLADCLQEFDTIHLPKSTKERNAIAYALGLLYSRLAQLS